MNEKVEANYVLETINDIWLYYLLTGGNENRDIYKVHIAIAHDQATIKKALDLILPILMQHRIRSFKTVNPNHLLLNNRNTNGKEFCIYMQTQDKKSPESKPVFWITLLNKIEDVLLENNIAKNPLGALGDLLFPGSKGYIYYRNSYNICQEYVSALLLNDSGFTKLEACEISHNNFFNSHTLSGSIATASPKPAKKLVLTATTGDKIARDSHEAIINSLTNQLKNSRLLQLFVGTERRTYCQHGKLCDRLFQTSFSDYLKADVFNLVDSGTIKLTEPFKDYLAMAAKKIAKLGALLIKNNYRFDFTKLGCILPALYFNFYVPLYLENATKSKKKMIIQLREEGTEKLVHAIVRCCLRDTSKLAINYAYPQYIHNFSEEDIDLLLTYTSKQTVFSNTLFNNKIGNKAPEAIQINTL